MLPQGTLAGVVAIALAATVAPSASARPVRRVASSACTSLGKGPLGFNASGIGIYSTAPPQSYLIFPQGNSDYLTTSPLPKYDEPEMYEFFNCTYTPPEYEGKGATAYYQGYIKTADGQCVTASGLEQQGAHFSKRDCIFNDDSASAVDATQNFQFSTDTFFSYHAATFLGSTQGPVPEGFAAGGNYHYNLAPLPGDNDKDLSYLTLNYLADEPNKGDLREALIGQLGNEYKVPPRELPDCKLIKQGSMVLVDADDASSTKEVTITNPDSKSDEHDFVLRSGSSGNDSTSAASYALLGFYQCDSSYMGYKEDSTNYYGHLALGGQQAGYCFSRHYDASGPQPDFLLNSNCETIDDASQPRQWFHLSVTDDGYEVSYLNSTASQTTARVAANTKSDSAAAAQPTPLFGWTVSDTDAAGTVVLNVNPSKSDNKNYKLRFAS